MACSGLQSLPLGLHGLQSLPLYLHGLQGLPLGLHCLQSLPADYPALSVIYYTAYVAGSMHVYKNIS